MNSKVVVMKKIGLLSIALVLCLPAYAGDSLSLAVGSKVDYFNIGKKILFAGSVAASIYTLKVGRDRCNKKKAFEDTSFTDSENNVTISVKDILRDSGRLKQLSKTTDFVNFKKSCESLINDCSCSGFNPLTSLANYFAFGKGYLSSVKSVSKSIDDQLIEYVDAPLEGEPLHAKNEIESLELMKVECGRMKVECGENDGQDFEKNKLLVEKIEAKQKRCILIIEKRVENLIRRSSSENISYKEYQSIVNEFDKIMRWLDYIDYMKYVENRRDQLKSTLEQNIWGGQDDNKFKFSFIMKMVPDVKEYKSCEDLSKKMAFFFSIPNPYNFKKKSSCVISGYLRENQCNNCPCDVSSIISKYLNLFMPAARLNQLVPNVVKMLGCFDIGLLELLQIDQQIDQIIKQENNEFNKMICDTYDSYLKERFFCVVSKREGLDFLKKKIKFDFNLTTSSLFDSFNSYNKHTSNYREEDTVALVEMYKEYLDQNQNKDISSDDEIKFLFGLFDKKKHSFWDQPEKWRYYSAVGKVAKRYCEAVQLVIKNRKKKE